MTNQDIMVLLQKAGITTVTTGGLLNTEQSEKFIQTTVDQSAFLKSIRIERNIGTARDLDTLGVGTRLLHKPVEDTNPNDDKLKGVIVGKRTLTPVEVMLPYNISLSYLEENIEKQGVEDTINTAFSKQFSNDLVDLMLNGDTTDNGADKVFLNITESIYRHLAADANKQLFNRVAENTDWKGSVFPGLLKLMPSKHKADLSKLSFLVSHDLEEEYRSQLADRNTALGDSYLVEGKDAYFKGVKVEPVPCMPYGSVLLTNKQNLAAGFGREITVYKQFQPRARRVEYTITAKIDFDYVLTDLITYCR